MADEAERMQRRLEEVDEHSDAAEKKAQVTREQAGPQDGEAPGDGESPTASS